MPGLAGFWVKEGMVRLFRSRSGTLCVTVSLTQKASIDELAAMNVFCRGELKLSSIDKGGQLVFHQGNAINFLSLIVPYIPPTCQKYSQARSSFRFWDIRHLTDEASLTEQVRLMIFVAVQKHT